MKVFHMLAITAMTCLAGTATAAECGPGALGTTRTIMLKREGALYGTNQHKALPLAQGATKPATRKASFPRFAWCPSTWARIAAA